MSESAQNITLTLAVVFSYLWISVPSLNAYALQATALLILAYTCFKLWQKKQYRAFFPSVTGELFVFVSALLLLIGHTGGITSGFLPSLYFLMFIAVFGLKILPLALLSLLIPTFLWAITPHTPSLHEISTLLSFPLLIPLMLFAKLQYNEVKSDERELKTLSQQEHGLLLFLTTYLRPKLLQIQQLSLYVEENKENLNRQLNLLLEEVQNILQKTAQDQQESQELQHGDEKDHENT